jgi:phage portal protein BeeE
VAIARYERARARQRTYATTSGPTEERVQIWPPLVTEPRMLSRQVWDAHTAKSIPSVGKALHMHQLAAIMPLDAYRGPVPLPRPAILEQPDLSAPGATWYIQQHVEDWYLSGNACSLVTVRDDRDRVRATRWRPAEQWGMQFNPAGELESYTLQGTPVDPRDVIHVRRGHADGAHGIGVGIVEQYLATLDRVGMQEEAERGNLRGGAVPSVVIVAPQKNLTQANADAAAESWTRKLGGPGRHPVILPNGSQVVPLGWSASDNEMTAARQMSLTDVANLSGLDPYWLGAPGSSHTYKSPGPMWLAMLRITLEPMLGLFEDAWSQAFVPRGQRVRFDRLALTRDDLETTIRTLAAARKAQLLTYEESRIYLGQDPTVPEPRPTHTNTPAAPATGSGDDEAEADGPASTTEETTP